MASIRWSVALAGLLVAIAALLAAVIFGAYTWVKADIAEKYFKADYNLNFYIFCEAPEHVSLLPAAYRLWKDPNTTTETRPAL